MDVQVNILAIVLATLSSMVIGYFWYNPKLFGNTWIKLSKIDPKKGNIGLGMGSAVLSSFIMAFGLAYASDVAQQFFDVSFLQAALETGLFVFVAFQGVRMFQRAQFNQDSHTESLIHIGNEFVTVMVMALIIGLISV